MSSSAMKFHHLPHVPRHFIFSPFPFSFFLSIFALFPSPCSHTGPHTGPHSCFTPSQRLSLCPSLVTPVISWARSTGATSASMRQGLCVVAWYSPFSWLGNNPHYNSLSHTYTWTHTQYDTHTDTHIHTFGTLIYGSWVCRRKFFSPSGKTCEK